MAKKALEDVLARDSADVANMFSGKKAPAPAEKDPMEQMEIRMIPIDKIVASPFNFYAETDIQTLADSIELSGLLTPLGVIQSYATGYRVVSGHRRLRALRQLHDRSGGKAWREIPCVVYPGNADRDREELMLIQANSTARELTSYEKAMQIRKTKEVLTRMRDRGEELPGRIRDQVAKALKMSRTNIARVEAIDRNLIVSEWRTAWIDEKIPETTAYRISQCPKLLQAKLWHHFETAGVPLREITTKNVEKAIAMFEKPAEPAPEPEPEKPDYEWTEPREYEPPIVEAEQVISEVVSDSDTEGLDDLYIATESIPGFVTSLTGWLSGEPQADGRYLCTVVTEDGITLEQTCDWRGGEWLCYGQALAGMFSVRYWWPLPPKFERWMMKDEPKEEDDGAD